MVELMVGELGRAAVLGRTAGVVLPALRRVLSRLHPDLAVVAGYHCGLIDRFGRPEMAAGGKMLRPALVFLAADTAERASGARSEAVVAGAVAVQLVHEFSLLHDDIMDRDRTRRGRPAAWTVWGIERALLCGDGLLMLATAQLTGRPECAEVLVEGLLGLCSGQADDLACTARPEMSVAEWEHMAAGKTGALMGAACQLGALLAGADRDTAAVLHSVGVDLGLAFQAIDDWLGVWGDPAVTGKPVGADLAVDKRTLPVAIALGTPGAGSELRALLKTDHGRDVAAITTVLGHAGASARTRRCADEHLARVADAVGTLAISSEAREQWKSLIDFLAGRIA